MKVFEEYAHYYDLLYADKDYASEAVYIDGLIQRHLPGARTVLNMGCGTGAHDFHLVTKGYQVTGVDNSGNSIRKARSKQSILSLPESDLHFKKADIRSVRLDQTYDVVISLFHVMSYQNTNNDLEAAFKTAKTHLKPGGLFLFDCWYGPAVLTDPPAVRVKTVEDEKCSVTRIAEPEMFPNENLVGVNYRVMIKDKETAQVKELQETHTMRYLFRPEIERLLSGLGFTLDDCVEWMTGKTPGFHTWNVCFVASDRPV